MLVNFLHAWMTGYYPLFSFAVQPPLCWRPTRNQAIQVQGHHQQSTCQHSSLPGRQHSGSSQRCHGRWWKAQSSASHQPVLPQIYSYWESVWTGKWGHYQQLQVYTYIEQTACMLLRIVFALTWILIYPKWLLFIKGVQLSLNVYPFKTVVLRGSCQM